MFVIVDTNERDGGFDKESRKKHLERIQKVFPNAQPSNLVAGDVNVILDNGDILAIERKTATDFMGSIREGHIFNQVEDMASFAKWSCIIIEGSITFENGMAYANGEETNWKQSSIQGAKWAIEFSGCPIVDTTYEEYPYTIANVINFCSRPDTHWQNLAHRRIVTFPPIDLTTEILSALPGVGLVKAKSLVEFAGSQNEQGVGLLGECLSWATSFPLIAAADRPKGWGDRLVENVRASMGLRPYQHNGLNEYLNVVEDKPVQEEKKGKK